VAEGTVAGAVDTEDGGGAMMAVDTLRIGEAGEGEAVAVVGGMGTIRWAMTAEDITEQDSRPMTAGEGAAAAGGADGGGQCCQHQVHIQ